MLRDTALVKEMQIKIVIFVKVCVLVVIPGVA